ncbi:hypothetical protein PGT21_017674 [Puccinia graminis f. sp. tritici]|uniref:Uncharacterized protein n=1 Tax=Puccinia graminis f. sp. tritici TaxID=56615 RepID=A0A5B0RNA0_PUCGR|nr:hypothetical protein PGT21_017674 [Puccinia graminis f. sp. tritici]KAA1126919.1 hypothetical protein PGTUg99_031743 [Puccinia graminis f. sp. tritici]
MQIVFQFVSFQVYTHTRHKIQTSTRMNDSSSELSQPDIPEEQKLELRRQADLVIQDFRALRKYPFSWPANTQPDISIERLRSKKDILTRLDSTLLPRLRQQCASLSGLLCSRYHLREDLASTLQLTSEIQANLHLTLGQTIEALNEMFPGRIPEPCQTDDQHFEELKIYRLYCFNSSIRKNLKTTLRLFFELSGYIIKDFKLSKNHSPEYFRIISFTLDEEIASAIGFLKESELSLIWDMWKNAIGFYDDELEGLLGQLDPDRILFEDDDEPLSEPAVELGTSLVPIFKLSRLFFKKLYRQRIKKKEVNLFTEMCSNELLSLDRLTKDIHKSLYTMWYSIQDADRIVPINTSKAIMNEIVQLLTHFQSYLSLIYSYILPNLFPNVIELPSQNHFCHWYATWTVSFLRAIINAVQVAITFVET